MLSVAMIKKNSVIYLPIDLNEDFARKTMMHIFYIIYYRTRQKYLFGPLTP